jgi:hypothetical protein
MPCGGALGGELKKRPRSRRAKHEQQQRQESGLIETHAGQSI